MTRNQRFISSMKRIRDLHHGVILPYRLQFDLQMHCAGRHLKWYDSCIPASKMYIHAWYHCHATTAVDGHNVRYHPQCSRLRPSTATAGLCIASSLRKIEARIKLDPSSSVVGSDEGSRQIDAVRPALTISPDQLLSYLPPLPYSTGFYAADVVVIQLLRLMDHLVCSNSTGIVRLILANGQHLVTYIENLDLGKRIRTGKTFRVTKVSKKKRNTPNLSLLCFHSDSNQSNQQTLRSGLGVTKGLLIKHVTGKSSGNLSQSTDTRDKELDDYLPVLDAQHERTVIFILLRMGSNSHGNSISIIYWLEIWSLKRTDLPFKVVH
ncbi:hypothetical protein EDD85DRAFT_793916 [Armillaria nabsnona]|nr:hypothetical protein EDD85DRAFT_793916 [Armillaria nabsnona]